MSQSQRIACVFLPTLAVQDHLRNHTDPPALIISEGCAESGGKRVHSCSRRAWEAGVRPGMRVTSAQALCPEAILRTHQPALVRDAKRALAESLMALSEAVDIRDQNDEGTHCLIYLRVPKRARGEDFGQKILRTVAVHGYRARVGIADSRFASKVAAQFARQKGEGELFARELCSVPRGGGAAFLAPHPIDLLPLSNDLLQLLKGRGVTTLGDFADLPPPSVARRWDEGEVDYQSLARGEGPTLLHPHDPDGPLQEEVRFLSPLKDTEAIAFALRPLCERVQGRLQGRQATLRAVELRLVAESGEVLRSWEISVEEGRDNELQSLLRGCIQGEELACPAALLQVIGTLESPLSDRKLGELSNSGARLTLGGLNHAIEELERRARHAGGAKKKIMRPRRPQVSPNQQALPWN